MDIIDRLELFEAKKTSGEGTTTVNWEVCDPRDKSGDTCEEIEIDINWLFEPEEPDVGWPDTLTIEEVKFSKPTVYMGKKYRASQDFPKNLRKHVLDFVDSRKKFKNWDDFIRYEIERADRRF
jgi:hypothetical protein